MPAIYAHNKFGKKVITKLSPVLQDLIHDYPDSFRIGLQGPDTLFFYHPYYMNRINQTGVKIHKEDAYPFFNDALSLINANGLDSASHAYLLGFICHFALDRACHPYVNASMKSTKCGHLEIEGDFDHYLLQLDGKKPHLYRMHKLVPTNFTTAMSLAPFYPTVPVVKIHTAMRHMKLVKRLFVAPGKIKRTIIDLLMKLSLHYKFFKGHMLFPEKNEKCRHCSEKLYEMFLSTVSEATHLIEEFETALIRNTSLPDEFHGNFNGN